MSSARRPSALRAVNEAWARLPLEVLESRLTSPGTTVPSSLAWTTVVIKVTPDRFSKNDLRLDKAVIDADGERNIHDSILANGELLASTARLLEPAVRLSQRQGLGDKRHLLANAAFELAASLDDAVSPERAEELAADLVAAVSGRLLARVEAVFDEPESAAELSRHLDRAWEDRVTERHPQTPPAESKRYLGGLGEILNNATFRVERGAWVPHFTDREAVERAWSQACELDCALSLVDPVKLGLDDDREQEKPPLASMTRSRRPLDTSVRDRARRAAIGAQSGGYEHELAAADEIAAAAVEAACSMLGLARPQSRAGLALGAVMFMHADPDADLDGGGVPYASRKLARLMTTMRKSGISDRGRIDRLYNAIATAMPKLWVALHNLEYRGDLARDLDEVWKRVGGEPETLVRDFKLEYQRDTAEGEGTTVVGIGTPASPDVASHDDDPSDEEERAAARTVAEADNAVLFTLRCMDEADSTGRAEVIQLTGAALRHARDARELWAHLIDEVLDRRIPVGVAVSPAQQRVVVRGDLADYDEFLGFLDRHRRRTEPGTG